MIAEIGAGLSRAGATRDRRRRARRSARAGRPAHAPAGARLRAERDVLTGSRAAAAGGFTAVLAMANTRPSPTPPASSNRSSPSGEQPATSRCGRSAPSPSGWRASGSARSARWPTRAPRVRVFSDDGKCVYDALLMRRALEYVKTFDGVIAQHAQEPRLTEGAQMNEGAVSAELGLAGWPAVAEEAIIARDVLLAEHVGARLHVCHLSTAGASRSSAGRRRAASTSPPRSRRTTCCSPTSSRAATTRASRSTRRCGATRTCSRCARPWPTARSTSSRPTTPRIRSSRRSAPGRRPLRHGRPRERPERRAAAVVDTGLLDWADVARVHVAHARRDRPARRLRHAARRSGSPAHLTLYDPAAPRVFGASDLHGQERRTRRTSGGSCPGGSSRRSTAASPTVPTASCAMPRRWRDEPVIARCRDRSSVALVLVARRCCWAWLAATPPRVRRSPRRPASRPPTPRSSATSPTTLYVATTRADEPLERIAVGGLGFRARAASTVTDRGICSTSPAQPRSSSRRPHRGVGRATWTIDRVVEHDGLVFVALGARRRPTTVVDSYLRLARTRPALVADRSIGALAHPERNAA